MNISTFFGLNVGMSALDTMQQAEDVVSNNIANANTTGYVRETASISEQAPFPSVPANDSPLLNGQLGQGSEVASVARQTNAFINEQDRANQGTLQMFQTHSQNLTQIESILNEPSSMSMQNAVDQFFASWQTLSTDPSNTAARQAVISQAQTVGQTFQTITTQLEQMQSNTSNTIIGQVNQLNQYASQVAKLNGQITTIEKNGQSPNQLLDQRGNIINEMAKLANITYTNNSSNPSQVDISIVGTSATAQLVSGTTASTLQPPGVTLANGSPLSDVGSALAYITSGTIAGNLQTMDDTSKILANNDAFLSTLAQQVNNQQSHGVTLSGVVGPALFQTSSDSMGHTQLSITTNFSPSDIAAGTTSASGDNTNALAMVSLQNSPETFTYSYNSLVKGTTVSNTYSGTFDQSLAQTVSSLGIETSQINSQLQTANSLASQSSNLRQSISGVDINGEAAKMVEYQNVYNAAAKFITVYNSMLQTLIGIIP